MSNAAAEVGLPLRTQDEVECRRCEVHCEKVVYPGACIRMACPFVYAYEAWGRTYMGCLQKVFDVEIDLSLLEEAESSAAASVPFAQRARRSRCAMWKWSPRTAVAKTISAVATQSSMSFRERGRASASSPASATRAEEPGGLALADSHGRP